MTGCLCNGLQSRDVFVYTHTQDDGHKMKTEMNKKKLKSCVNCTEYFISKSYSYLFKDLVWDSEMCFYSF